MDSPQKHKQKTELTIQKALQFAGDNSQYQKKRLLLISLITLTLAVLTCKVSLMDTQVVLLFLAASGLGQLLAPVYLSLDQCAVGVFLVSGLAALVYPFSSFLVHICFYALGFLGRGFFSCSLIYLNQIGGERFRAWSLIVVFAIWGVSSLLSAFEYIIDIPTWVWYYGLIFIPAMVLSRKLMFIWKPSPYFLYNKRLYSQAKQVLNDMAQENTRPPQQYDLQGQNTRESTYIEKSPSLYDLLFEPSLSRLTIPLLVLWIYRQYIYFGSFTIIPEISREESKTFILISISQTVAVLMSYPIRSKIKRVSTLFTLTLMVTAAALVCSFITVPPECRLKGQPCTGKFMYRICIMVVRFSIALTGNVLIGYTLQVYPANLKHIAYTFLLCSSSAGSILLPWVNQLIIKAGGSGFIALAVFSLFPLFFTPRLPETGGINNQEIFVDWEKRTPLIPLEDWQQIHI